MLINKVLPKKANIAPPSEAYATHHVTNKFHIRKVNEDQPNRLKLGRFTRISLLSWSSRIRSGTHARKIKKVQAGNQAADSSKPERELSKRGLKRLSIKSEYTTIAFFNENFVTNV